MLSKLRLCALRLAPLSLRSASAKFSASFDKSVLGGSSLSPRSKRLQARNLQLNLGWYPVFLCAWLVTGS